ncbi:PolC-type DNA polymerase III [Paenibacillus agilis]|uniref:3'-5' exonuclease n=1 Tax=Paenibacillus agilis TaxID=3020863 RepID=A0A559J3E1_9BACL|nr:3'-5' exonuclease [Paenibacillus agilis]TVX94381.1 3'-5' exonuclease [Paenibacillus agilis]
MEIKMISDTDYAVSGVAIHNFRAQRYCVFDFESTGINHETEHITQIGAIIIENNRIQTTRTFNSYVQSPKPIPEAVEQFTGVYNTYLEGAPVLKDIYREFAAFTEGCVLITHAGYEFDLPLLRYECARNHLPMLTNPCIDTKALFSYLHPDVDDIIWMDYLIKRYEIYTEDCRRHDALGESF